MHKNLFLLFWWWWRFSQEDASLWKRIISFVHRIKGTVASKDGFCSAKFGMRAQFIKSDEETSFIRNIVSESMSSKRGVIDFDFCLMYGVPQYHCSLSFETLCGFSTKGFYCYADVSLV